MIPGELEPYTSGDGWECINKVNVMTHNTETSNCTNPGRKVLVRASDWLSEKQCRRFKSLMMRSRFMRKYLKHRLTTDSPCGL